MQRRCTRPGKADAYFLTPFKMKPFMVALDEHGEIYMEQKPTLIGLIGEGLRSALWVLVHGYEPKNRYVATRDRR